MNEIQGSSNWSCFFCDQRLLWNVSSYGVSFDLSELELCVTSVKLSLFQPLSSTLGDIDARVIHAAVAFSECCNTLRTLPLQQMMPKQLPVDLLLG